MKQNIENLSGYRDFQTRFKLLAKKNPFIVQNTLSNIFTMRIIGNKTHGDLAEIGISEFIHQFMYDFDSDHVGKKMYRAKKHEEDIIIKNEITQEEIPISLKAYGDGPLQLSTDKTCKMFPKLEEFGDDITDKNIIQSILKSDAFNLTNINVFPLIYREKTKECNIMVFDFDKMKESTDRILRINSNCRYNFETKSICTAKGRKYPIYMFLDKEGKYIAEVRYGGVNANALQRGFWTHTISAYDYFDSLTEGWISYKHNLSLVQLFSLALNCTKSGHESANVILQTDIDNIKNKIN